ncbi:hypothetical protein HETIRDRAFT_166524 [Heterobasidion irregulare TC 32-1]|uniref:Uncharacterized protein n=1 Tax=Heterobasidion irregulare (strain TC 32-1) TaxID=747525 RepID=W4KPL8_HETIT|nr:uncharacterized protein HETIRDRAFT_166524 [Heterobasidion irregulare TC 32-1]ETW87001.1 hypothetical protein HETIRDRAFT_166524 [Heterobasidion irregulare TC 32-1]
MSSWFTRPRSPKRLDTTSLFPSITSETSRAGTVTGNLKASLEASPIAPALASAEAEPRKRAFTAALSTPHDSVLSELQGQGPDHDPGARLDATPAPTSVTGMSSDTLPRTDGLSSPLDTLYDPFTGAPLGVLSLVSSAPDETQNKNVGIGAKEELWTHLARIRSLQAEIAGMHVTMEGIGVGLGKPSGSRGAAGRRGGGTERLDGDGAEEGAEGIEGEGEEAGERRLQEREDEFEKSEEKFEIRKAEIDGIMHKALTTFHALEPPTVDFAAVSRSNTTSTAPPMTPSSPSMLRSDRPGLLRLPLDGSSPRIHDDLYLESPVSAHSPLPTDGNVETGSFHM